MTTVIAVGHRGSRTITPKIVVFDLMYEYSGREASALRHSPGSKRDEVKQQLSPLWGALIPETLASMPDVAQPAVSTPAKGQAGPAHAILAAADPERAISLRAASAVMPTLP
ncbi:hypothetical protein KZ813_11715 [Sphingomonas sp. RHCKR7]|uniref:hypothetical protein n=1 Tax=Sphingomonas folli TaxID=2862497 RepID=UPI001CA527F0|nr:hypothetical protein [Sphingomonas folli]MBW6527507.1 hypothetical protein [Sphingomonas folli]